MFFSGAVWLVEHHLDLLVASAQTKRKLRKQPAQLKQLKQLEQLRHRDVSGRDPTADVISPQQSIALLDPFFTQIVA